MSTKVLKPSSIRSLTSHVHTPFVRSPLFTPHRRTFLSSAPADLSASRTLSYPAVKIYDIIADIESYPHFIPYCKSAKVTSYSKEDEHYKRRWPHQATLTIGYGDRIQESFTSRVYCVPPVAEKGRAGMGYVEAVSGEADHKMTEEHIEHHNEPSENASVTDSKDSPMEYLRTRWTVRAYPYKPAPKDGNVRNDEPATERCDVTLNIHYKFKNPMYDMMSRAVAPKMADMMVEAFEKRVDGLLK